MKKETKPLTRGEMKQVIGGTNFMIWICDGGVHQCSGTNPGTRCGLTGCVNSGVTCSNTACI